MDLRDLRYFETIAQLEHVGRAADLLGRTQPALTSSVRRLERECGSPLFEKAGRGIRLTSAGHVLLKWAQRTRIDIEDAKREVAAIGRGHTGHVRIGIVPTAAQFLLPTVARQMLEEAPDVTLSTVVGLIDTLKPKLRDGEIDLMVGTESPSEPGLESRVLAEDSVVVTAVDTHPLFQEPPTMKALTRYAWALQPQGAPTRDWLDHAFDRKHLPRPRVQVEATMLLVLPSLIAQTGLLSFISRQHLLTDFARSGLREIPVKEAVMRRRLVISYRSNSFVSPAAMLLIKLFAANRGKSLVRPPRAVA